MTVRNPEVTQTDAVRGAVLFVRRRLCVVVDASTGAVLTVLLRTRGTWTDDDAAHALVNR